MSVQKWTWDNGTLIQGQDGYGGYGYVFPNTVPGFPFPGEGYSMDAVTLRVPSIPI
jgi:hypothetical protein